MKSRRFSWRAAVVLVATLLMVLLTARLGVWQLDRAGQKVRLQNALEERGGWPALHQDGLPTTPDQAQANYHRPVQLRGRWVAHATVFLENRQMKGRPGFFVLTPLLLDSTGSPPRAILVQRGWLPRDNNDRTRLPAVSTASELVQVTGLMAPPPARLLEFESAVTGRIRQNLDVAAYSMETGLPLLPYSVVQTTGDQAADDGLLRDWPAPAVDVHKHHGYAFQWFSLAALLTGLYVWFQLFKPWRARHRLSKSAHDEN